MPTQYIETASGVGLLHTLNLKDDCVYVTVYGEADVIPFLKYDSSCNVIYKGKRIAKVGFTWEHPFDRFRATGFKMTLDGAEEPCVTADISYDMRDFTDFEPICTKFLIETGVIDLP